MPLQVLFHAPVLRNYFLGEGHTPAACQKQQQGQPCLSCEMVSACAGMSCSAANLCAVLVPAAVNDAALARLSAAAMYSCMHACCQHCQGNWARGSAVLHGLLLLVSQAVLLHSPTSSKFAYMIRPGTWQTPPVIRRLSPATAKHLLASAHGPLLPCLAGQRLLRGLLR